MKKFLVLIFILWVSLMNAQAYTSLYSDHKSFAIGDILTVIITESSKASSSSQSRTDRQMNHGMQIDPGVGRFGFVPLAGMSGNSQSNFRGDAATTRDNSLSSKITVRIVDIDMNGNLMIEGSRVITVNGEEETTTLTGIVRAQDVAANNSIQSYNIADAKISYNGKGPIEGGSKVGLITKVFNFLF